MPEVYGWPEGSLWVWTGSHTASGNPVAFVSDSNVRPTYQWQSDPTVSGSYRIHLGGVRFDANFNALFAHDTRLKILYAGTANTHIKFQQSGIHGTAGWIAYSGRINQLSEAGGEGRLYTYSLGYFSHIWSAY